MGLPDIDVNLSGAFRSRVSRFMQTRQRAIINIAGWYGDEPLLKQNHAAFLSSQLGLTV
jgi:hypothetical protein